MKVTAVLCTMGGLALIAAACTTPTTGGGTTNFAPIAVVSATPLSGAAPLAVDLSGALSSDADGSIVAHSWDFGDGATGSGATTSHTFTHEGDYTVTLTVRDDKGATAVDTEVISVSRNFDGVTFVDDDGVDGPTCGDRATPCATIGAGLARAGEDGDIDVYVAAGVYPAFAVIDGIDVVGGFAADYMSADGTTLVSGSYDATAGVSAAVRAADILTPTSVSGLTAQGADESASGRASYAVHVVGGGTGLRLDTVTARGGRSAGSATGVLIDGSARVTVSASSLTSGEPTGAGSSAYGIRAINGARVDMVGGTITSADGIAGIAGGAAPGAAAAGCSGGAGGNAGGPSSPGNGGAGCATAAPANSGAGGRGGDYSDPGAPGTTVGSATGGNGGCGSLFSCGTDAGGGAAGAAGPGGAPGAGGDTSVGGGATYVGAAGGPGGVGTPGSGAGGGGGGKSASASGGGGGGGGGGGAAGTGATIGGTAGGGSFGVFAVDATVLLTDVSVISGNGGSGGAGQPGGRGGDGGKGGNGGTRSCCLAGGGGGGGGGGAGGGGGGAGGGAGGPSVALLHRGAGTVSISGASLQAASPSNGGVGGAGGAAGSGGAGGSGTQDAGDGGTAGAGSQGSTGSMGAAGLALGVWDNGVTTDPTTTTPTTTTTSTTTTTQPTTSARTPVDMMCQTTASGQTRYNANPTGATVEAPTHVAQGSTFQVSLTPDPMNVPTSGEGYPIAWIANVKVRFAIPAGTTFVGATVTGGSNLGTGTVSAVQSGDSVLLTVPGTLAPGVTAVLPKVTVTLQASGASGSSIETRFAGNSYGNPSLNFQTRVTNVPLLGSVTSTSNCFASVNPVLSTTTID